MIDHDDWRAIEFAQMFALTPALAAKVLSAIFSAAEAHVDAERDCLLGRSESDQAKMLGPWASGYSEESARELLSRCGVEDPAELLVEQVQLLEVAFCEDKWGLVADEWYEEE